MSVINRKPIPEVGFATRYCITAILINSLWFAVLLVFHRYFFLGVLELSPWELFILFQMAGLTTAILFKKQITEASNKKSIFLGLVLPFFALYAFIVPMLIYKVMTGGLGGGDIGASLFWGPIFLVKFFYIIIPLGLISQFVMRFNNV